MIVIISIILSSTRAPG